MFAVLFGGIGIVAGMFAVAADMSKKVERIVQLEDAIARLMKQAKR